VHGYLDAIADGAFDCIRRDFERFMATSAFGAAGATDVHASIPWDEQLLKTAGTGTHPAGGCCIGEVVDPELRVYGLEGLSVADASVFPQHVSNNPNLTCHAVGEAAAVLLAGDRPLQRVEDLTPERRPA
jgi:choline dehydrogenase-like flavoprotein